MRQWGEKLGQQFTKLPGIRTLHDFVNVKHILSGEVIMHMRELCYMGSFESSKMKVARGVSPTLDAIPKESSSVTHGCKENGRFKVYVYQVYMWWPEFLQEL